jgi:hypothetical protein
MLSAASSAQIGVIVRTNSTAMQARALLYEYRKELGDPTLSRIQIRFSPDNPDTDLWLFNTNDEEARTIMAKHTDFGE